MKIQVSYNWFLDTIFFSSLFFFNIGSKEIFRVFDEHKVTASLLILFVFLVYIITTRKKQPIIILYILALYTYLIFRSISSTEVGYAFEKATLGILLPLFSYLILKTKKWNEEILKSYFKKIIFIITLFAIIFKLKYGFFQRVVPYGFLGPITFGWLCGMAFLIPLFEKRKTKMDFLQMVYFFTMIIWSASKGPILSALIIMIIYWRRVLFTNMRSTITLIVFFSISFVVLNTYLENVRSIKMFIELFNSPEEYIEGAGKGSFGSRLSFYEESQNLFLNNPIVGVGFGDWGTKSSFTALKYPHNIFIEILSEIGILGLTIFLFVMAKIWSHKNIFGIIGLYGLISLQFSGDFSYLRYALFPYLISYYLIKIKK